MVGEDAEITVLCENPGSGKIEEMVSEIYITQSLDEVIIAPSWYTPDRYSGLISLEEIEKVTAPKEIG